MPDKYVLICVQDAKEKFYFIQGLREGGRTAISQKNAEIEIKLDFLWENAITLKNQQM